MGEIYLAQDTRLGRQVALKFLPASFRENPERLRRFQHEARAASSLNHPNVATIYEIGEVGDVTFIAMEYIEGLTLDQKIGGRPLGVSEILNISIQIADALDDAHARGVASGRGEESLAQMQRSKELDPASLSKVSGLGETLNMMGRTDEAIAQHHKALELDPNSGFAHWSLGNVYVHKRMYDEAIKEYEKAIPLSGTSPDEPGTLAYAYAKSGRRKQALQIVEELIKRSEHSYVPASLIAITYAALDDHDAAFKWLQKAVEQRDGILAFINVDPLFQDIRSDPRYAEILQRIKFK